MFIVMQLIEFMGKQQQNLEQIAFGRSRRDERPPRDVSSFFPSFQTPSLSFWSYTLPPSSLDQYTPQNNHKKTYGMLESHVNYVTVAHNHLITYWSKYGSVVTCDIEFVTNV